MLFHQAEMFNRRASRPKFKAAEIFATLQISVKGTVADIGSGGGYFTMRFAEAVGLDGKVYALDTNPNLLNYIAKIASENQMTHIETVLIADTGINLPGPGCDLIFLRNVFHHIEKPVDYFKKLKPALKPGGKIAVIDYRKGKALNFITLFGHCVAAGVIHESLQKAGCKLFASYDFLPEQSFDVFQL